jgi:hypothetical protein
VQAAALRREEGVAYKTEKEGEKNAYTKAKKSEGDRIYNSAMAEASRLQSDALNGPGSERLVGLEMAKSLCNLDRIVWPVCGSSGNPLDINNITKMLSGTK